MKSVLSTKDRPRITIGELCEALADGELPATVEDGFYLFTRRDLRQFVTRQTRRSADQAATEQLLLAQVFAVH